jgi:hypothetical protein
VLFELGENAEEAAANLASALESLLRDPARAAELGKRGAEAARNEYSMARFASRLVELTSSLSARL